MDPQGRLASLTNRFGHAGRIGARIVGQLRLGEKLGREIAVSNGKDALGHVIECQPSGLKTVR